MNKSRLRDQYLEVHAYEIFDFEDFVFFMKLRREARIKRFFRNFLLLLKPFMVLYTKLCKLPKNSKQK